MDFASRFASTSLAASSAGVRSDLVRFPNPLALPRASESENLTMWSLVSFSDSSANSLRVAEQLLLTRNPSMENLGGRSFPARNFPLMTNDDTVPEVSEFLSNCCSQETHRWEIWEEDPDDQ